jgi:long-subunit acyl-CoA synthetase (AMP-forming)
VDETTAAGSVNTPADLRIGTGGGKIVAPAVLEDRLRAHPLISQCMVVGDAKPSATCLVARRYRGRTGLGGEQGQERRRGKPGRGWIYR